MNNSHECSACGGTGCGSPFEWAREIHVARRRLTGRTICRTPCPECDGSGDVRRCQHGRYLKHDCPECARMTECGTFYTRHGNSGATVNRCTLSKGHARHHEARS